MATISTASTNETKAAPSIEAKASPATAAAISTGKGSSNSNAHTNRLIKEKSPYLQQHAHNPVDWYPWSQVSVNYLFYSLSLYSLYYHSLLLEITLSSKHHSLCCVWLFLFFVCFFVLNLQTNKQTKKEAFDKAKAENKMIFLSVGYSTCHWYNLPV
jgi:hypothetical protein